MTDLIGRVLSRLGQRLTTNGRPSAGRHTRLFPHVRGTARSLRKQVSSCETVISGDLQ
jgi:hypothetical protein